MSRYYERIELHNNRPYGNAERWRALIAGAVLVALPVAGWLYRGWLSWTDVIVGLIGIGALALAVQDFLRRRDLARALRGSPSAPRHTVCPRSGEPLMEDA